MRTRRGLIHLIVPIPLLLKMSEVGLAESAQYVELRKWVGTVRPLTMDSTGSGPNCGLRKPAQHSRLHGRRGEL